MRRNAEDRPSDNLQREHKRNPGLTPGVIKHGDDVWVKVQGENFSPNSIVILGGVHLDTEFVADGELNARVPSEETVRVGNYQMGVFTPRPGGGTTEGMTFVIEYK